MDFNSFVYDISQMITKQGIINENIVIIGTQQHSSTMWRNILPGVDVGSNSKFMFVHQAIRTVRLGILHKWCILLCNEGYSSAQQWAIRQAFDEIKSNDHKKVVIDFQTISSPQDIISYINEAKKRKHKIGSIYFYSHGVVKKILPWMKGFRERDVFDEEVAKDIHPDSFTNNAKIYSYACRTGLGNPKIDQDRNKYYVYYTGMWSKISIEPMPLKLEESLAQKMANASHALVYAFLRRTDYSNTLFTSDEYDFLDACDASRMHKKAKRQPNRYKHIIEKKRLTLAEFDRFNRLNTIRNSQLPIDGGIFRKTGALHSVSAAETPKHTSPSMFVFRLQKDEKK